MVERDPGAERRASFSPLFGPHDTQPAAPTIRVTIGARSHEGVVRLSNDDHYLVMRMGRDLETLASSLSGTELPPPFKEHAYAMFVADGLGSGGAGSVASRVALSTIA